MRFVTTEQAREMDRTAIEEYAIPEMILMENAAKAALQIIEEEISLIGKNFLLICGPGNNGGDGLALARLIYSKGGAPVVLLVTQPEKLKGSAQKNYQILNNFPVEIITQVTLDRLRQEADDTDLIVDALLGTGLSRQVDGFYKALIEEINLSEKKVLSIDIPSGIHGDTGQVMGSAVKADYTVSFGALKPGNFLYPGYDQSGKLALSRISFPPEIYDSPEYKISLNFCPPLPPREEQGHKKSFGNILTISGAATYYGAPYFAASAVLKCGSGFSRLAAPESLIPVLAAKLPEAVFMPMKETEKRSISLSNLQDLQKASESSDCTIIGPGLSLDPNTAELICSFVRSTDKFTVIDGDALSAIAGKFHFFEDKPLHCVLTPHTGEMTRLCATTAEEIMNNPLKWVSYCSERYNAITVYKGPHSLIALPDGSVFINQTGNSGMGTAGSGDILAGMIGGLYGLGLDMVESVKTAVCLHGAAGDLAAIHLGRDGMTATDILDCIPQALKSFRENPRFVDTIKGQQIREV